VLAAHAAAARVFGKPPAGHRIEIRDFKQKEPVQPEEGVAKKEFKYPKRYYKVRIRVYCGSAVEKLEFITHTFAQSDDEVGKSVCRAAVARVKPWEKPGTSIAVDSWEEDKDSMVKAAQGLI
jgi:hypothetical protein